MLTSVCHKHWYVVSFLYSKSLYILSVNVVLKDMNVATNLAIKPCAVNAI